MWTLRQRLGFVRDDTDTSLSPLQQCFVGCALHFMDQRAPVVMGLHLRLLPVQTLPAGSVQVIVSTSASSLNAAASATASAVASAAETVCRGGSVQAASNAAAQVRPEARVPSSSAAQGLQGCLCTVSLANTRRFRQGRMSALLFSSTRIRHGVVPYVLQATASATATATANAAVTVITTGNAKGCGSATSSGRLQAACVIRSRAGLCGVVQGALATVARAGGPRGHGRGHAAAACTKRFEGKASVPAPAVMRQLLMPQVPAFSATVFVCSYRCGQCAGTGEGVALTRCSSDGQKDTLLWVAHAALGWTAQHGLLPCMPSPEARTSGSLPCPSAWSHAGLHICHRKRILCVLSRGRLRERSGGLQPLDEPQVLAA